MLPSITEPTSEIPAKPGLTRRQKIFIVGVCALVIVAILGGSLITRVLGLPQFDSKEYFERKVRENVALNLERSMKENGCRRCEVWADGPQLMIADPRFSPRRIGERLNENTVLTAELRKIGFKNVKAVQGESVFDEGFVYPIN